MSGLDQLDDVAGLAERLHADLDALRPLLEETNEVTEDLVAWAGSRQELRTLAGELIVIGHYARRVLDGEQPTDPRRALEHVATAIDDALASVTSVNLHDPGALSASASAPADESSTGADPLRRGVDCSAGAPRAQPARGAS